MGLVVAAASRVNRKPSQHLDQTFRLFTCSKKSHGKTALIVTIKCRSKRVLNKHHLVFVWLVLYETIVSLHFIAKRIYFLDFMSLSGNFFLLLCQQRSKILRLRVEKSNQKRKQRHTIGWLFLASVIETSGRTARAWREV
jgi:hypothetical protein